MTIIPPAPLPDPSLDLMDNYRRQPKSRRLRGSVGTDFRPHTVYLLLDAEGVVVYVGCSRNVERRLKGHQRAEWWPQVASYRVIGTWERRMALDAEWGLIQTYEPPANFVGTNPWRHDMRLRQKRRQQRVTELVNQQIREGRIA